MKIFYIRHSKNNLQGIFHEKEKKSNKKYYKLKCKIFKSNYWNGKLNITTKNKSSCILE